MDNIYVAKIGKTVGLKGQLKLHIDTDFPEQFKKNATFITHKKQELQIESINLTSKTVKFFGINSIEDAQRYINAQLLTTKNDTIKNCKLEKKQFFWFDIEQCNVFEDGKLLGKIKEIHRYPIDDYLEVETSTKLLKDKDSAKTFMIPYNDSYILDVNIDTKIINVQNAIDIFEAS
ncbi:MAG: 16S rRNA processing protein RimM [Arcobacteraceae bacterium]|nr:16S rRNA processing protein RimM [Arcobacteraceae bacterium]